MSGARLVVLVLVGACCRGAPAERSTWNKEPPPVTATRLTWRSVDLPFGVTFDVPTTGTPAQGVAGGMSYYLHEAGPIRIGAWTGGPWSLSHWRGVATSGGGQLGPEQTATVCGRTASRQEATMPGNSATGAFTGEDGQIGHVEHVEQPEVRIVVSLELAGAPVVIEWAVAAADRDAHRSDEAHFFASIRCS